jgi:hypothetical protein
MRLITQRNQDRSTAGEPIAEYLLPQSALAARLNAYRSIRSVCRTWSVQQQQQQLLLLQGLQPSASKNSDLRILAGVPDVRLIKFPYGWL